MKKLIRTIGIKSFWALIFLARTFSLNPQQVYSSNDSEEDLEIGKGMSNWGSVVVFERKLPEEKIPERNKLFLGGGDLSYELSFAKKHPEYGRNMVATTYDSEVEMKEKYPASQENKRTLESLGVVVFHGVDATKLNEWGEIKNINPKDIYFSHPHTNDRNENHTSRLVDGFFKSAAIIQRKGYLLHMPRVRGGIKHRHYMKNGVKTQNTYKSLYGFRSSDGIKNYRLIRKVKFSDQRYNGWQHQTTDPKNQDPSLKYAGSTEYIFEKLEKKKTQCYSARDSDFSSEEPPKEGSYIFSESHKEELKEMKEQEG